MACKGICRERKTKRVGNQRIGTDGIKWCKICGGYMIDDKIHCDCCGMKYRTRARYSKAKKKMAMEMAI